MKVAVLMLSYERYDTLKQVLEHNLGNSGYPFDLYVWDNGSKDKRVWEIINKYAKTSIYCDPNQGIAKPLNVLTQRAYIQAYDAFHVMANDILEPDGWLADKVRYLEAFPLSGMISICPGPIPYEATQDGSGGRFPQYKGDVIGQFMISRHVWEKVGRFNEQFGLYGPIDNDYNARCSAMGLVNYYIPGQSIHLDHSRDDMYGYDKAALVAQTWPIHVENVKRYQSEPSTCYIPVEGDHILNMQQYFNQNRYDK